MSRDTARPGAKAPSSPPRAVRQAGGFRQEPAFYLVSATEPAAGSQRLPGQRPCFIPPAADETKLGPTKPFSDLTKTYGNRCWVSINLTKRRAAKAHDRGPS